MKESENNKNRNLNILISFSPLIAAGVAWLANSPDARCCLGMAPIASLILWVCLQEIKNPKTNNLP